MASAHTIRAVAAVLSLSAAGLLAGCAAGLPADQAGVKVLVRAEPKAGYKPDPTLNDLYARSGGPEDETTPRVDPYRLLDYDNLDDVVVYLEPQAGSATATAAPRPPELVVDAAGRGGGRGVRVSAVGGGLRVGNSSARPRAVYLRHEGGGVTDVGTVTPNGRATATLSATGVVGVYAEAEGGEDERLAEVFVAPTGWVARTVGGGRVTFGPVPPGRYTLHTWHPRLPGQRQPLDLPLGRYSEATAAVGVNVLPKVP